MGGSHTSLSSDDMSAVPERTMKKTWVLVADSEKARLFEFERCRDPWVETTCLVNPETPHGEPTGRLPRV